MYIAINQFLSLDPQFIIDGEEHKRPMSGQDADIEQRSALNGEPVSLPKDHCGRGGG